MRIISVILFGLLLSACSVNWVKLTPQGENVAILQAAEVSNCTPNGTTTVSVISKVIVNRQPADVQEELRTLARNRAADRGDAIVATGAVANGEQTYNIYRCRR
ncbi:MAG: DUF4156 domain-containing protein [Gammaproteobacteria bacterium]|jgi:hypothetical protein